MDWTLFGTVTTTALVIAGFIYKIFAARYSSNQKPVCVNKFDNIRDELTELKRRTDEANSAINKHDVLYAQLEVTIKGLTRAIEALNKKLDRIK